MGLRRRARHMTLQVLYRLDTESRIVPEKLAEGLEIASELLQYLSSPEDKGRDLAYLMVKGVCEKIEPIDEIIDKCVSNWTIDRLAVIDRNILRIAVFEMKFLDDILCKVAINEAIEMGKEFGTEQSGKFINGVLDKVLRMIGSKGE